MSDLPASAQVVVIGGGAMGTSTLYHLASAGCTDAVLVERDTIGAGSTSKAAGGFRAQFSDELNIRIALAAIDRLARFEQDLDTDIDFKQWGYLFLLEEDDVPLFTESVALQNDLGVPSRLITPHEAAEMVPGLFLDDIAAASYSPLDGYATPESLAQGYASAAVRLGATIVQGCTVEAIEVDGGSVAGVRTSAGSIATGRVVCVAGVWTKDVLVGVGLDVPVRAEKRYVHLTGPGDGLPRKLPLTIDFTTAFYFQRESDGLLFGGPHQSLQDLAPAAIHRLPVLADLEIKPGWWGYYAMSPDHNAIIDEADEPAGLSYATGFSGHGFQQSPIVGEYLAARALDEEPPLDLGPFSSARFSEDNGLKPEVNVI